MALIDVTPNDSIEIFEPSFEIRVSRTGTALTVVGLNDTSVVTDTVGLDLVYGRTLTDSVAVTEFIAAGKEFIRDIPADNVFCEDERVASTFYNRSAGFDEIDVTDDVDIVVIISSNDAVDITDQLLTETSYVRFALDTPSVTDAVQADTVFPQDVVTLTDQLQASTSYVRGVADTLDVTDFIYPEKVGERGGSDTISVTDAKVLVETVFPIDNVSIADTLARTATYSRAPSDTLDITEELALEGSFNRSFSDSLSVTDAITAVRQIIFDVVAGDTVSLTDAAAVEPILDRAVQDDLVLTEQLQASTEYTRSGADAVSLTDAVAPSTSYIRALSTDAISVADAASAEPTLGRLVSDAVSITDSILREVPYERSNNDPIVVTEQWTVTLQKLANVVASDAVAATDSVLAESIDVDIDLQDTIFVLDTLATTTYSNRVGSDVIAMSDAVTAKRGGEVDRAVADTLALTDTASYRLFPGEILDLISIVDTVLVERVTPLPVVMDADGYGLTVKLPGEIRYDRLEDSRSFDFQPYPEEGVPFQVEYAKPIVTAYQTGAAGKIVYQGGPNFFSPVFRITGGDPAPSSSSVAGKNITTLEAVVVSDSYKVEVLGAAPVTRNSGFSGGDVNGYLEISNGKAPGLYRIVSVLDANRVTLDRPLPVVDNENGTLNWKLTSAIQSVHFRTTQKITNQANYLFRAHGLLTRNGGHFDYAAAFYTSGINGPRVSSVELSDDGYLQVTYDQPMQSDHDFVYPGEYTITGPSVVRVKRVWSVAPNAVAMETGGLEAGSYTLHVNYAGTPKDVAGNPIDPVYSEAVFTGAIPLNVRSIFTDKGPIAKPGETLQRGFGATIDDITELTLPGATLSSGQIGYYIRLGALGLPPTTSSLVAGTNVIITDTVAAPDALKVELVGAVSTTTVFTSLSGIYRLEGILAADRARVSASFSPTEASSGSLYWELINPRNGEIADDPSDVMVKINGEPVAALAVIGLLGQVVLNAAPLTTDDVKIDYSWVCNPTVEFRQLNSKEFKLNSWNRDVTTGSSVTQHKYRYNNTLITPAEYEPLDTLAKLDQPEEREMHYRAYERAYTPVLNDPTLLLLNSPIHKIAFPPAQRPISEEFVTYEATVLPDADGWTRHGVGATAVSAGVLTVTDNTSGEFPYGQPIFWTRELDLTFPHAFAMSWRFFLDTVPIYNGVFSGVAAGYTDEKAAYVVGFLNVSGVRKIGLLKRGSGDDPSLVTSWTGGIDSGNLPTDGPVDFDWHILHSYRIFRDLNGVIRLFVDGDVAELLRILPDEAPFLEELGSPFDEIQGAFFGSISRPAESVSKWDFVRYLILPTNPLQTSPSSFVSYEATVTPEVDSKPWTPIGFHGTETIIANNYLLLDSTSATDAATAQVVGLLGGDFKGFVRMEPLLSSASQVAVDVSVQLRTYTHGVDPYGLIFAVDDGTRLTQVAFLNDRSTPKFSYGGRSLPEDFSPYVWSSMGGAAASLVGRLLLISDTSVSDGKVYYIEDSELPSSDDRVIAASTDYFLEFRAKVVSYTVDGSGFAGAFSQVFDGTRAVGVMLQEVSGVLRAALHADGVPVVSFPFDWGGDFHTYRLAKNTTGNLVSLFIDGAFIGSAPYSSFSTSGGNAQVSFGSATPSSSGSRSQVEWAYCNAWRTRSDLKHYVGIWKGYDDNALTGYHLPLKEFGRDAAVVGNALGDTQADFFTTNVAIGDKLIVDAGPNKGVYAVAGVSSTTTLTITGSWPLGPTLADYRIVKETDWTTLHQYRLVRDTTGDVSLLFENDADPIIRIGYNSIDLPSSGSGIIKTLTNGLAAIAFGSFSSENLEQSYWDFVRYGITRTPHELRIAPHHQVLNQWNVMQSPERLYTVLPHELTSYKSSSTGVIPKKDPDFLADSGLRAYTILNDSTPLVPSTQTFQVRAPFATQSYVSVLNSPEGVLNNDGDFTLNDGTVQYHLIVPDDVLYSSLDVIEQSTGEEGLLAPFGDCCGPEFSGFSYTKEVCLDYTADVLPEDDTAAPTPWARQSDTPGQVFASVAGGVLTYGTFGSKTVYKNNTTLPDAPGLQTEASFRLRIRDDATLGTGDTQVRFGLSAPGLTAALAFVTTPLAERYVFVFDLNNGAMLGAISHDFLDGEYHTYRLVRDPGAGVVRVSIDSNITSSRDIALMTDRPFVTDAIQTEIL